MKTKSTFFILVVFLASCGKENVPPSKEPVIPGGKNGSYHIAIFPEYNKTGYSGKVYIKYGTKSIEADTRFYNDSSATMTEPGYTHHAHFNNLQEGFYAIKSICKVNSKWMLSDTIIEIKNGQLSPADIKVQLK